MPPMASPQKLTLVVRENCKRERRASLAQAMEMHIHICKSGLQSHGLVGNYLVPMLASYGSMSHAQKAFDLLVHKNELTLSSLIIGYAKHSDDPQHAFLLYKKGQDNDGIHANAQLYLALIKVCTKWKYVERGHEIYGEISQCGMLDANVYVSSALVTMFVRCGCLDKAREVFDKQPSVVRDVVSWNALLSGYVEHQCEEEVLSCFNNMLSDNVYPDEVTFLCVLRACCNTGDVLKGKEIHIKTVKRGFEGEVVLGNTLIDMYAKFGFLAESQQIFSQLVVRDVVGWTSLIAGYAEDHGMDALRFLEQMQQEGVSPDAITYVFGLKACGDVRALVKGEELHSRISREMLFQKDIFVGSTLLDMYMKCGCLVKAREVFEKFPVRDVVSWNALISGYIEHGCTDEALDCFEKLQNEGYSPDIVTFIFILKACSSIGMIANGQLKHAEIVKIGLEKEDVIGNTLIDMYAKCGFLVEALEVFGKLEVQSVVSWTALISGYAEYEHAEEALHHFEQMQHKGVSPGDGTFLGSLKACGNLGATIKGQGIHIAITIKGLEESLLIGNTLVDVYAKCGSLTEAQDCFDKLQLRTVISWTALLMGYAQIGKTENVLGIFEQMLDEGMKPNFITFMTLLTACSHTGLVEKGHMYFEVMCSNNYGFVPTPEHYACMIDLLGRAGHIEKAVKIVEKMPYHPGTLVWRTILGACQKWGDVEYGYHAFEHAIQIDKSDAATYVGMANILAEA